MDYAAKGRDFQQQAEKKLKGGTFSRMFGGSSREEAATELLEKAATQYKLAKSCEQAQILSREGPLLQDSQSPLQSLLEYEQATTFLPARDVLIVASPQSCASSKKGASFKCGSSLLPAGKGQLKDRMNQSYGMLILFSEAFHPELIRSDGN